MGAVKENNFTHVPMFGDAIQSIHTAQIVLRNHTVQNIRNLEMVIMKESRAYASLCSQTSW